jgi:hypothetical protein
MRIVIIASLTLVSLLTAATGVCGALAHIFSGQDHGVHDEAI